MLGDVSRRSAVFAAQGQALNQAQCQKQQRGQEADAGVGRQQTDGHRRAAHKDDGDEESVFAPDKIADAPEDDRAEGSNQESGSICGESGEQRCGIVAFREK